MFRKLLLYWRLALVLAFSFFTFFMLTAFQDGDPSSDWQEIFKLVIIAITALIGAPITQFLKNLLSKILGKPFEDRAALVLSGLVAGLFALAEMYLAGVLDVSSFYLENFPATFFAVFTVATVYYAWMKESPGFFGRRFLLKKPMLH